MKPEVLAAFVAVLAIVALADGKAQFATKSAEPAATLDLATALRMYYVAFQKIMPCGYGPYNMPTLAPFSLDFGSFNVQSENNYKFKGNYSNIFITGLDKWHILKLTTDPTTNRTSFDIIFNSEIQVLAEAVVEAWVNVGGFPVSATARGPMNLKVIDYRVIGDFVLSPITNNGNLALSLPPSNGLKITDFNFNFYIGDIISNTYNTNWDIAGNNLANKFLRESMLMWVQQIQAQIHQYADKNVLPILNQGLQYISMDQIINMLIETSTVYNYAAC